MKKHIAFLILILLAVSLDSAAQTRIRVNNTPGVDADFSDLQEAITSAGEGDIIYIESSGIPYSGNYHVDEPFLTLIGPGYFLSLNDSTQADKNPAMVQNLYLDVTATGAIVMGLQITGTLFVNASSARVSRCHLYTVSIAQSNSMSALNLYQNYITGTIFGNNSYLSTAVIYNNIITTPSGNSFSFYDKATLSIYNNIIANGYSTNYWVDVENSAIVNNIIFSTYPSYRPFIDPNPTLNNQVSYNVICQEELSAFPNNVWDVAIEDVVLYTDGGPEGKYVLIDGSPAIGAGNTGGDCGIFAGTTPYVYSGLPPVPHIFESNIPLSGSGSNGLPVHIKAKTQH
jgi:hypothetical protein